MLPHRQDQKKDSLHGSWVYLFCQSSPFIICEHAQLSSTAVNRSCFSSTNALTITVMNGVALRDETYRFDSWYFSSLWINNPHVCCCWRPQESVKVVFKHRSVCFPFIVIRFLGLNPRTLCLRQQCVWIQGLGGFFFSMFTNDCPFCRREKPMWISI